MKFLVFIFLVLVGGLWAQCPLPNAVIYESESPFLHMDTLARYGAPIIWFSPDEPDLMDDSGVITLPEPLPFDSGKDEVTVYYKVRDLYVTQRDHQLKASNDPKLRSHMLNLSHIKRIELEYFFYYSTERGAGSHPHDLEHILLQIAVHENSNCNTAPYALEVKRVIARAHGLYWYDNTLNVDDQTLFPITILVEEGKHANCTDKNADGIYTPGYDVNEKVNDAWGVRDIISTGRLINGGFQAWMQKQRKLETVVFPPPSSNDAATNKIQKRLEYKKRTQYYLLKSFPKVPTSISDEKLSKLVKKRKALEWPKIHFQKNINKKFQKLSKDNKLSNKLTFSYRISASSSLSTSMPLLIFKHVEAPMTGGWFYHKIYGGSLDLPDGSMDTYFGHQIQHASSASRWVDSYVGMGYELVTNESPAGQDINRTEFVSEIGIKIRMNITLTPFKFLKFLGTDFWGIKLGWRNQGFSAFQNGAFVIEIGAGAF